MFLVPIKMYYLKDKILHFIVTINFKTFKVVDRYLLSNYNKIDLHTI